MEARKQIPWDIITSVPSPPPTHIRSTNISMCLPRSHQFLLLFLCLSILGLLLLLMEGCGGAGAVAGWNSHCCVLSFPYPSIAFFCICSENYRTSEFLDIRQACSSWTVKSCLVLQYCRKTHTETQVLKSVLLFIRSFLHILFHE